MLLSLLGQVAFSALLVSALTPTPTKRTNTGPLPPNQFVTADNDQFSFNGKKLAFVGTNAYWLSVLNSDEDIDATLGNISSQGITVVRTWGFNGQSLRFLSEPIAQLRHFLQMFRLFLKMGHGFN
jgi:mannan endo-1,4-beta-mannosidase